MAGPPLCGGLFLVRKRPLKGSAMMENTATGRVTASAFKAAPWLKNRHLQTIFPSLPLPRTARPALTRQLLDLPDGDATVIDWLEGSDNPNLDSPLLLLLHGLESSAESSYARQLMAAAEAQGWGAAVLHFRDCGDYRNRLPRRYHAGETNDFRYFVNYLVDSGFRRPLMAVGYSLGGNVLLKYLGEERNESPLAAAAAVSVPLSLQLCADALTIGFSKVYQAHLLKRMKSAVRNKFNADTAAFDWQRAMNATSFAEFDDAVTAPLHGFTGKDEYYEKCSSLKFLRLIERPTLVINSSDDPFMSPEMLPGADALSPLVTLEISQQGGHVGFVEGGTPWRPQYFLPGRLIGFLSEHLPR